MLSRFTSQVPTSLQGERELHLRRKYTLKILLRKNKRLLEYSPQLLDMKNQKDKKRPEYRRKPEDRMRPKDRKRKKDRKRPKDRKRMKDRMSRANSLAGNSLRNPPTPQRLRRTANRNMVKDSTLHQNR